MRTSLLFVFILSLALQPTAAQLVEEEDSLLLSIQQSNNDSINMELYNKLRRLTYYSDSEKSMQYTKKYLRLAEKNKYPEHVAIGQFYMGNAYVTQSEYDKALNYYLKSAKYFEKMGDSSRLSSVFNGIGAAYEHSERDELSLKYFRKSYHISEDLGDNRRAAIALNNIANIYTYKNNIPKTIELLNLALTKLDSKEVEYRIILSISPMPMLIAARKRSRKSCMKTPWSKSIKKVTPSVTLPRKKVWER